MKKPVGFIMKGIIHRLGSYFVQIKANQWLSIPCLKGQYKFGHPDIDDIFRQKNYGENNNPNIKY